MGETKNNPLFVTPQPAVFKRPLSCQSVITFCISSKMKKDFTENSKFPTKYLKIPNRASGEYHFDTSCRSE